MENDKTITFTRPTGPRIRQSDESLGQLAAYRAGALAGRTKTALAKAARKVSLAGIGVSLLTIVSYHVIEKVITHIAAVPFVMAWQGNQALQPAAPYAGPGDIVTGASMWWGLRGYTTAYSGVAANICTPLDAACADVSISGGNFNLGAVGALTCNNTVSICTVKVLYDQTAGNNCNGASCDLTDGGSSAARPTLIVPGAANGCTSTASYCMSFNGTNNNLFGANNINPSIAATTQSAVATRTGNTSANSAIFGSRDFDTILFFNSANTVSAYSNPTALAATASDSAWHSITGVYTAAGTSSGVTVDGSTTSGTIGTAAFGATNTPPYIGNAAAAGFWLTGKISEIGVWGSNFNGTQLTNMNNNQHAYWGF